MLSIKARFISRARSSEKEMRMRVWILLLALLAPSVAMAAPSAPTTRTKWFPNASSTNRFNLLEGVALNAAAATRTITVTLNNKYSEIKVIIDLTRSASTDMTFAFSGSFDGTKFGDVTSRKISTGVTTISQMTESNPGTASRTLLITWDVLGLNAAKIVFGGTAADGSDLVDVQVVAVVGG